MRHLGLLALVVSLPLIFTLATSGDVPADRPIAYRGARILTAAGAPIDKGVLIVRRDKIVAVGADAETAIPEGAEVIDLTGKTIMPGLVDTHSHIGIWPRPHVPAHNDGNEGSGPVQSALRALDAIQPDDPGIRMATAGGVTTANIMPGSANVIGGQTVYVKLRGRTIEAMRVRSSSVLGGLKMANGENPKRWNYEVRKMAPATRMKIAALQREQFTKARDYQRQWERYRKAKADGKDATQPEVDLALEPLVEVLERKRTVHFHSHRADDLMTAIRLAKEFNFELVLQHCTEGYRIVEELVREKIPVSLTLVDSPGGKLEVAGLLEENAALLDKAGVRVAINTDDSITESRFLLRTGRHRRARRHVGRRRPARPDAQRRPDAAPRRPARLAGEGKGRRFRRAVRLAVQRLHAGIADVHRRPARLRSRPATGLVLSGGRLRPARARAAAEDAGAGEAGCRRGTAIRRSDQKPWRATSPRFAILAGRIDTVSHGMIHNGTILVEDGKIKAVGVRREGRPTVGPC